MVVSFRDCVFDAERRLVTRAGKPVDLSPKAFALLGALIGERPRVVSRATLQDLLWPNTFVGQTSLARLVTELRQALGDTRKTACIIRTAHGFGYALCGDATDVVSPVGPVSSWSVLVGGRNVPLVAGENLIGRAAECVLRFNSPRMSRRHARVMVEEGGATIEDLGSKNGTAVRGRRIAGVVTLRDGDEVVVGSVVLVFQGASSEKSTETGSQSRPDSG
jgi:DNA-binding winged helix-turn-helix (wHTH) protein